MPYKAWYIPNGPKNLAAFFPDVDFSTVAEYYLEVVGGSGTIATTPMNQLDGECCGDRVRIHFLNYLGAIDAINFKLDEEEFEAKSDDFTRPQAYPYVTRTPAPVDGPDIDKSLHFHGRFNVTANNTLNLLCNDYPPEENGWIDEVLASPLAWIEWPGDSGQDLEPGYLPIVIQDARIKNKTSGDPWVNSVPVSIQYSHDKVIIRN